MLFKTRAFAAGVSVVGLQNLAMYALLFELPLVLTRAFGGDARTSGRTLLALTLAMVAGSLSGSRLVTRFGARGASLVGSIVALAGMVYVGWQTPAGASDLVPGLVLVGVGIGLSTPAVQTAAMAAVERAKSGMAAGVSSTARYLGGVIGVGVVSTLTSGAAEPLAAHRTAARLLALVLVLAIVAAGAIPGPATATAARES
jgi:MFS family permease